MIMNIIFFVCFAPIGLVLYFVMRNEIKPKKNIILGVTLPLNARETPAVLDITKRFLSRQNIILIVMLALLIPQFFFRYTSIVMTWYFSWITIALILPAIPYVTANSRLKALKIKNGWFSESSGAQLIDLKVAAAPKKILSVWFFIPAFLLTLIPVIHSAITLRGSDEFWPMMIVYLTFALTTAAFYLLYRIILRQKADIVDENTSVNAALTQIRRYNWNKIWLLITWLTSLFVVSFWLFGYNSAAILILTVAYTIVLLVFAMQAEFKTRNMQQKLTAQSGKSVYTDDDDKWIFGTIYNNPNDTHFIVNKRIGIGTTINLAKTSAKILMVFMALIVLAMPLTGIWLMKEEFTPVRLEVTADNVIARHISTVYSIALTDIQTAYLIDTLPDGTRTNGTAMDTVEKGNFRLNGIGESRLCLDPQVPPFIVIITADHTYIFGSHQNGEARAVYDALMRLGTISNVPNVCLVK